MDGCCDPSENKPEGSRKHRCPTNGIEYAEVSTRTIAHHIKQPWQWDAKGRRFYFCEDPACEVVYFADDDSVILKSQLRTNVGVKETGDDALLCYCYGVTRGDALSDPAIREFVVAETKTGRCACETSNPSGRCCLKDFPRAGKTG